MTQTHERKEHETLSHHLPVQHPTRGTKRNIRYHITTRNLERKSKWTVSKQPKPGTGPGKSSSNSSVIYQSSITTTQMPTPPSYSPDSPVITRLSIHKYWQRNLLWMRTGKVLNSTTHTRARPPGAARACNLHLALALWITRTRIFLGGF